jgi:aromatic ring hydroxylase
MGLRTGDQYLAGLRDGRRVWLDGKPVEDPTTHPGLRNTALTIAQYYDMQNNPALEDLLTYETPDGDRAHLSFIEPKTKDDLRRRGAAFAAWSEVKGGLMGRAPDYMNACMMAVGNAKHLWGSKDGKFGDAAYPLDTRAGTRCDAHSPAYASLHRDMQPIYGPHPRVAGPANPMESQPHRRHPWESSAREQISANTRAPKA